jgi:Flp pilus assembly protein TadD
VVYLLASEQLAQAEKWGGANASLYDEIGSVSEKLAGLQPKLALERMKSAIAAYSTGIKHEPKNQKLLLKRGWARIALEEIDEARQDFVAAVAIDAADAESHAGLGYTSARLKNVGAATRHAALATLHGSGDYLVLHNIACIYGALSLTDPARTKQHQDITLEYLQRAVEFWKKGNKSGPDEIQLIRDESNVTFPPALRKRPEYLKILADNEEPAAP